MDDNTFKLLLAVVNSGPALIGGLAAIAASYFSWRSHVIARETKDVAKETKTLTEEVVKGNNGLKTELVEATKAASFAAGKLSESLNPGNQDLK